VFLPDVNVWLALAFQSHARHAAAKAWIETASLRSCCFCRVTQMSFLRLSTNRSVFPSDALPLNKAWEVYQQLLSDHHVVFAEEPDAVETTWRAMTQHVTHSTNVWTDAYLAAFAQAADFEIVTFDKGFLQYMGTRCMILSDIPQ